MTRHTCSSMALLASLDVAVEHLARCLMALYGYVERTGQQEKLNHRCAFGSAARVVRTPFVHFLRRSQDAPDCAAESPVDPAEAPRVVCEVQPVRAPGGVLWRHIS